jgi:hypothetical protein
MISMNWKDKDNSVDKSADIRGLRVLRDLVGSDTVCHVQSYGIWMRHVWIRV